MCFQQTGIGLAQAFFAVSLLALRDVSPDTSVVHSCLLCRHACLPARESQSQTAGRELGKGGIDTEKTAFLVHETIYARGLCGKQK